MKHALTVFALCLSLQAVVPQTSEAQERIISTNAAATELLFTLGQADALVAVDVTSQLPASHQALPRIGYHRALPAEGLLSLSPTQLIGSEHMGPDTTLQALQQANVHITQLPTAMTLEQLESNIQTLATQLNTPATSVLKEIHDTQARLKTLSATPLRSVFLLSTEGTQLRLAGVGTAGHSFMQLLSVNNVAMHNNYRNISAEALMAMEPELILVAGQNSATAVEQLFHQYPILAHSPAGKSQRIFAVPANTLVAGLSVQALHEAVKLKQQLTATP